MKKNNCYGCPLVRASFSLFGKRTTRIDEQKQFAMFGLLHWHRFKFFLLPSSIYSKRGCNFDQNRSRVNTFFYLGPLTHLRTDAGMGTQMHTCAHTCTHAQMLQAHAHTHRRTRARARIHTQSHTYAFYVNFCVICLHRHGLVR